MTEVYHNNIVILGKTPDATAFGGYSFCASALCFSLCGDKVKTLPSLRLDAPVTPSYCYISILVRDTGKLSYSVMDGALFKLRSLAITVTTNVVCQRRAWCRKVHPPVRGPVLIAKNRYNRLTCAGGLRL